MKEIELDIDDPDFNEIDGNLRQLEVGRAWKEWGMDNALNILEDLINSLAETLWIRERKEAS